MEEEWTFLADEKVQVAGVAPKDDHVPLVRAPPRLTLIARRPARLQRTSPRP